MKRKTARPFRSVLCPIDFSSHSRAVLRHAAVLATRSRARVTVLFVNDPLLVAAAGAAYHDRTLAQTSREELIRFTASSLASRQVGRLSLAYATAVGSPASEIVAAAGRLHSDLIVLGTHGLTGANKLFFGSTTHRVLQRSPVPVLAVPAARGRARKDVAVARSWPGPRILAAIDLDRRTSRDAEAAADIARGFGAELLLVHVLPPVQAPSWFRADLATHERRRLARARAQLDATARRLGRRVACTSRVVVGHPPDRIAALASDDNIGLVVMTLREPQGLWGTRRGSIAYRVLSYATTPVLALPPR